MTQTMMKALAFNKTGSAMEQIEIPKPTPAANEILVQVSYSAIDTTLASISKKDISSGYIHDMKARPLVIGYHFSGTVCEIGSNVTFYKIGNVVFGHLQYESNQRQGAYSEYITVSQDDVALVPAESNVSLEKAAASTTEAVTALQALRDLGGLKEGQSVLIIGAGGGVGSAAVYIAKALGASNVTAVCSTKDVARVQEMGANQVIDRSKQDVTAALKEEEFDIVFDVPSKFSFRQGMKWLNTDGTFVNTLPTLDKLAFGWFWPLITKKRLETVMVESKKSDLELIGNWLADGQLEIDVDSVYKVSDFDNAWKRQDDRAKTGRVVIQVKDGW